MGQEYKEPTQQYYQHEDVSNNDDVAIIAGNLFFITLANYIDSRMSIYGKQQHTFLITSLIICVKPTHMGSLNQCLCFIIITH